MSSGFGGTPPDLPPVSDDFLFTPRFPSSDLRDLPAPDLRFDSFTSTLSSSSFSCFRLALRSWRPSDAMPPELPPFIPPP